MASSSPSSPAPEYIKALYEREKADFFDRNHNRYFIPPHTMRGLDRYVMGQVRPGSFLYGVLTNDLKCAITTADDLNLTNLHAVVIFVVNVLPVDIQGTPEKVNHWLSDEVNAYKTSNGT
jgi:hypothetical protein